MLIIILVQLANIDGFSQSGFTEVPPPPGSSSGWFIFGTQDQKGYMWFGSMGLHRYDGYSYTSFYNDPRDSTSLGFNRIVTVYADRKGFIWVGTNGEGLDRLDPETGIFEHFRHNPADPKSISNDFVSIILEDREGKIWVGTEGGGLNRLDPQTGIFTHFRHDPNDPNSLSMDEVRALYEDREGTLWIGTGFPFTHDEKYKGGGLNRYNPTENNFTQYLHDPKDPSSLLDNRIRCIYEDSKGQFWIGTAGDGLHTMDREKGIFKRHLYNAADPNALSRPPVRNDLSWGEDFIQFIHEDTIGNLWIGTLQGGINRYDPEAGTITHYTSLRENPSHTNKITQVSWGAASSDGVLWVAGRDGLFRIDPEHRIIPHHDIGAPVTSIFQEGNGKLWLGTENGLLVLDSSKTNKKKWFLSTLHDTTSLSNNIVVSIDRDGDNNIWIGTQIGLNRFDRDSQKFRRYFPGTSNNITAYDPRNCIWSVCEDKNGSFWLATSSTLSLMDRKNGSFIHYGLSQVEPDRGYFNNTLREDLEGYLWIGSYTGLNRFDTNTKTYQPYLFGIPIMSIFEATDSVLWVGTDRGLYYLDPTNSRFVPFTSQAAGLTANLSIFHILEDDRHSLWITTNIGLFNLGKNRSDIRFYGKDHGFLPSIAFHPNGCFKGRDGELFFADGDRNGYYVLTPEKMKGNLTAPQLHITDFKLGDSTVTPGKRSSFKLPLSETNEIHLPYNQNVFSFDFAGIQYSNPDRNQHLFMLENLDYDWRKAGEDRTAHYYNVPPGEYVFRVKAASANGVWSEKSIALLISPPWWATWWAYCIYGLLLIFGIWVIHKYQKARVIRIERDRAQKKELEQAREIEKAYAELKTTQAQLIQSEKMASLGELTAGIAHEIKNPLNFVNNFSEVNEELLSEMKEALDLGNIEDAKSIANDAINNQQKILHHGKRADSIVKGMLQHSRSSSGQKEATDINALADEYLRLAYHGLRAKDKTFNAIMITDFDESIGKIDIVSQDIGRVLLNLITNAFYACTERSRSDVIEKSTSINPSLIAVGRQEVAEEKYDPTVTLTTKKISARSGGGEQKDQVIISVRDNGIGIPKKVLNKIFHPFYTTKPTGEGTGLGLSISYDIVKAHGGELTVDTKEGEGTTFHVILPIV